MLAAGVPAMVARIAPTERVALGDPYRTATGQWVIDDGVSSWVGTGAPTVGPGIGLITQAVDVFTAHVPDPVVEIPSLSLILHSLVKKSNGDPLDPAEQAALDYAEAQG